MTTSLVESPKTIMLAMIWLNCMAPKLREGLGVRLASTAPLAMQMPAPAASATRSATKPAKLGCRTADAPAASRMSSIAASNGPRSLRLARRGAMKVAARAATTNCREPTMPVAT